MHTSKRESSQNSSVFPLCCVCACVYVCVCLYAYSANFMAELFFTASMTRHTHVDNPKAKLAWISCYLQSLPKDCVFVHTFRRMQASRLVVHLCRTGTCKLQTCISCAVHHIQISKALCNFKKSLYYSKARCKF
jgi:hypothetical protein